MKLLVILLALTGLSFVRSSDEHLRNRAAIQLNRLSAFKRTSNSPAIVSDNLQVDKAAKTEQSTDKNSQDLLMNTDAMKRIDELAQSAYNLYRDPNYDVMMERIKRSGSGNFVSGIASKVVSGVVGAVGGLSSGSSGGKNDAQAHDSYGAPVEPYGAKQLGILDFKKAILNTVIQALKALAGGALALKGQLIKGGGLIVQTKGRVLSSAGEAIASFGSKIASSAVISGPQPAYGAPGYSYNAPHHPQDVSYDGPPPSPDATYSDHNVYHHGPHGSPSSDHPAEESDLLILNEAKPGESPLPEQHPNNQIHENNHQSLQTLIQDDHHHNHISIDNYSHPPEAAQSAGALEESFGGPPKGSTVTKFTGVVTGTFQPIQAHQPTGNDNYYVEHKEQSVQVPQHETPQNLSPSALDYQTHQGNQQNVHQQNNQQFPEFPPFNPHLGISNDQQLNYQNQAPNGQQLNYQNQELNGQQLNYQNQELNGQQLNYQNQELNGQQINYQNQEVNGQQINYQNQEVNGQQLNYQNQELIGQQLNYQNQGLNGQQLNYQNQEPNGQRINDQNQGYNGAQLNYQIPSDYGFNGQSDPLKTSIFEHHNTLDAVNLGVVGLPNGYGSPIHGTDVSGSYVAWKRIGANNRMKKGTYWRYRHDKPKIHRI